MNNYTLILSLLQP